jgi:hypothetical protein
MKVGRNDPCPCGSGKKYKKCCGSGEEMDFCLPEELRTGTDLDEYMMLVQGVGVYAQSLMQFDQDGKELKKATDYFEKEFRPGTPLGVPDSLYMSWLHFDLRFGRTQQTVCERFLDLLIMRKLREPGPTFLRHMRDSYVTFYQVRSVDREWILFEELGTGNTWRVHRVNEPEEVETTKGDIWYVRFVGTPADAYIFSAPYVFPPESRGDFEKATKKQIDVFAGTAEKHVTEPDLFRESCRASLPFWARYFIEGEGLGEFDVQEDSAVTMPEIRNTDGDLLRFCKAFFTIKVRDGLEERISSVRGFDYDERNKIWVWGRKGNKMLGSFESTTLGTVSIKRKYLVAETNSEERASRLIEKLKKALKEHVSFEKMNVRDLDSMPLISDEKRKQFEKEHEELTANPEIRELLRQKAEDYYHKDWLHAEIPALGHKSPLNSVKTAEGRRKVEALLDDLDRIQSLRPEEPYQVDVNGLRKRLNLPLKT